MEASTASSTISLDPTVKEPEKETASKRRSWQCQRCAKRICEMPFLSLEKHDGQTSLQLMFHREP